MNKTLYDVTLVEIRAADGAQMYQAATGEVVWLCGPNRCKGVTVGNVGRIEYYSDSLRGWREFIKDSAQKAINHSFSNPISKV